MKRAPVDDPLGHIPMHPLELQVLLVLMEGDLHGYGIAKEIEGRDTGLGKIFPTNLYRRLRDMAEKGMISEAEEREGDQRRLFSITPFGRLVARAEAERLEALVISARRHRLLPTRSGEG
ncbi:MAG: PadR family transcriptional regulator [Gemmatimonadota bacterium]|jgi:DNA-binding PadR family transcriptional regulator